MITVTCAVPATAMSLAGIMAVSCVLLSRVETRRLPFHSTKQGSANPDPRMASANPGPPATAVEGESEVSCGSGLVSMLSGVVLVTLQAERMVPSTSRPKSGRGPARSRVRMARLPDRNAPLKARLSQKSKSLAIHSR